MGFWSGWRRQVDRDVEDELAFHIEMKARELEASGLPRDEARAEAHRIFGNVGGIRDDCIRVQGQIARRTIRREFLGSLRSDGRLALRSLRHSVPFTIVVVLILALGIGATTSTFSMLDSLLLKPLPYSESDRLGVVWERRPLEGVERDRFGLAQYEALVATTHAFDVTAAFTTRGTTLLGGGPAERVGAVVTTSSLLPLLGARPLHGRLLGPEDEAPGAARVIVLSHELWQRRFAGDPAVVGGTITLNGTDHEVVGVLAPEFDARVMRTWAGAADLFAPIGEDEGWGIYTVVGRRRADLSWPGVQAEMDVFAAAQSRGGTRTSRSFRRGFLTKWLAIWVGAWWRCSGRRASSC